MNASRIEGALCEWMPLSECVISRYVRVGTPEAEDLLRRASAALRAARRAHRRAARQLRPRPGAARRDAGGAAPGRDDACAPGGAA